jgi:hypothetical protein
MDSRLMYNNMTWEMADLCRAKWCEHFEKNHKASPLIANTEVAYSAGSDVSIVPHQRCLLSLYHAINEPHSSFVAHVVSRRRPEHNGHRIAHLELKIESANPLVITTVLNEANTLMHQAYQEAQSIMQPVIAKE